jgi:UDP-glucose 4-epimerase
MVLRTSRFFPEADDDVAIRTSYEPANVQANEMLYRRVDIEDVVTAHLLAIAKAGSIGFARYIISATSPFEPGDLAELRIDAAGVVNRLLPGTEALYAARGWKLLSTIGRVYVNQLARSELDWEPKYDFRHVLECLRESRDFRSALARVVGSKGYHDRTFDDGPYPVA